MKLRGRTTLASLTYVAAAAALASCGGNVVVDSETKTTSTGLGGATATGAATGTSSTGGAPPITAGPGASSTSSTTTSSGAGGSTLAQDCTTFYAIIEAKCPNQKSDGPNAATQCTNAVANFPPACVPLYEVAIHCYVVHINTFLKTCDIHSLTGNGETPCNTTDVAFETCVSDGGISDGG
jgi:hypothetical protein